MVRRGTQLLRLVRSLAEGRQEVIDDDDEYNHAVELVMQEEATVEDGELHFTISSIKL